MSDETMDPWNPCVYINNDIEPRKKQKNDINEEYLDPLNPCRYICSDMEEEEQEIEIEN